MSEHQETERSHNSHAISQEQLSKRSQALTQEEAPITLSPQIGKRISSVALSPKFSLARKTTIEAAAEVTNCELKEEPSEMSSRAEFIDQALKNDPLF